MFGSVGIRNTFSGNRHHAYVLIAYLTATGLTKFDRKGARTIISTKRYRI